MDGKEYGKLRLLAVLRLLLEESDAQHPLSLAAFCERLARAGIPAQRKAVGRDLRALALSGVPLRHARKPENGYFLEPRPFTPAEVRLLLDAAAHAPFLTREKTQMVIEKLLGLLSRPQAGLLRGQVTPGGLKFQNEEVLHSIEVLQQAISEKKRVAFFYHHQVIQNGKPALDAGRAFRLSPYALLWNNDRYYLAGNYDKYDSVSSYRLDRMRQVRLLPVPARPFEEVTPYRGRFDAADYLQRTFSLFSGAPEQLLLRCNADLLDVLTDRFGEALQFLEQEPSGQFTAHVEVTVSEGLYEWLLQYGARLCVVAPTYVREEMRRRISRMGALYGGTS